MMDQRAISVYDTSDSSSESESEVDEVPNQEAENVLSLTDNNPTALVVTYNQDDQSKYDQEEDGECEEVVKVVKVSETQKNPSSSTKSDQADNLNDNEKQKKKRKKKKFLYICLTNCKYESVRRSARRFGFKEVGEEEDWNLYWTDFSVSLERVMEMKRYQKINHFPGMSELCRKDLLARNLNRMFKLFPKEYNIFPRSWCLPADHGDFLAYTRQKKNKTYILKPESGCQGRGIWITKNPKDIKPHEHMLCQQYLSKPFLIDGFKFDLRIYALITSCDPLRIFVFKEGLGRFATAKYIAPSHNNVSNVFMHLTNYAINKNSSDFLRDEEEGSKRRISTINEWLYNNGFDVDKMWREIDDAIIKTLISAFAVLKHNYRTCFPNHIPGGSACFEILGFDVVLDKKLRPFVLEVNHSPSFTTDANIDREIKDVLLYDTLNLVNFGAVDRKKCIEEDRKKIKERLLNRQDKKEVKDDMDKAQQKWLDDLKRYEESHLGNFRRIYPEEGWEKYDKYFHSSGSLYQETAAFKARSECARQQREEISRKQEKLDVILKKKRDSSLMRPESPGGHSKARLKSQGRYKTPASSKTDNAECNSKIECRMYYTLSKGGQFGMSSEAVRSSNSIGSTQSLDSSTLDSKLPQEIVDSEEVERISSLLQRDNLVRSLGIVDHVYKLLQMIPNSNVVPPKPENKPSSFSVDNLASSALADAYHQPFNNQNYSYNALNNVSASNVQSYLNQRNALYANPTNHLSQGIRTDTTLWKNNAAHHRNNNIAQINERNTVASRVRGNSRSINNLSSGVILTNEFSRGYPASKITGVAATPPPLALNHDVEKQSLSYVKRSGLATSNFGLSIISAPAMIGQRPELSSASSILRSAQQQQSATVNGFLGYRTQKVPTRTVRGNSSGVIDL